MTKKDIIGALIKIAIALSTIFLIVVAIFILLLQLNGSLAFLHEDSFLVTLSKAYTLFKSWLIKSDQTVPFILAFVPAILGISYPLIIQTISNLNDKFQSTHIVSTFKNELEHRRFILLLAFSVVTSILAISKTPILVLVSLTSVVYLLIVFFRYSSLLLKYQDPQELFAHLSNQVNIPDFFGRLKSKEALFIESKISMLWHPIVDLLQYSIVKNDIQLYYKIKETSIAEHIKIARRLTKDNPVQQSNINELEKAANLHITHLDNYNALVRSGKSDRARQLLASGEGKLLQDNIRRIVGSNKQVEENLLAERSASSEP